MKKLKLIAILFCWLLSDSLMSQDFQFSQFYSAPVYLNPAMTGISQMTRFGSNYRRQWPGLQYEFNAYSAYVDHYSFDLNSGVGVSINQFSEQFLKLSTTEIAFNYAYRLRLSEGVSFNAGTSVSYVQKRGTIENLLFGDQIDVLSRSINSSTLDEIGGLDPFSYLSIGLGGVLVGEDFWLGFSGHHLNRPKVDFYVNEGSAIHWPKYSVHGGYSFELGRSYYYGQSSGQLLSLTANYKSQGPFQFLDAGAQLILNQIVTGVGYRGFTISNDLPKRDSIILLFGVNLDTGLSAGYSYDYLVSDVGSETMGSHEVSIRYQFLYGNPRSRGARSRVLKCFSYMF
jgi:type IX secretion system PorP/SprF family membrane protein